jgi:hypothetical protein
VKKKVGCGRNNNKNSDKMRVVEKKDNEVVRRK